MVKFSLALALASLTSFVGLSTAFTNPIRNPGGADPFVTYSGDGYYYMMTTTWTDIEIARSTTINGLKTATRKVIYSSSESSRCCNVWAPEVHWFADAAAWYVYFTAGSSDSLDNQRTHVLKGGLTPWDDYTYAGQLMDEWAIDGSVLRFANWGNFLMTSCFHGVSYQSICLVQLGSDYVSTTGSVYVISQPTLDFETSGYPVNEGPIALYWSDGLTRIIYSASYCWTPDYCLGELTWDGVTDPRSASAWSKHNGCVFEQSSTQFGTGHNSFFHSADGTETWMAYHATAESGGNCGDDRYTMIQKLGTHSDGSPNYGTPVSFSHVYSEPSS